MDTKFTFRKSKRRRKLHKKCEELEIHNFALSFCFIKNIKELNNKNKLSIKDISSFTALIISIIEFIYRLFHKN